MQYLLLQYVNETAMLNLPREEVGQMHAAHMAYTEAMKKAGVLLYDALLALTGSVVVAINRAVALATQVNGPLGAAEGLAALDALKDDALLARTGNAQTAAEAYRRAIGLESDPTVRRFLQAELSRTGACAIGPSRQATRR